MAASQPGGPRAGGGLPGRLAAVGMCRPSPVPPVSPDRFRQLEGIRRQAAGAGLVAYAFDNPDYYPSQDAVEKAFGELLARTPQGLRVFACGNSARGTSGDRCP